LHFGFGANYFLASNFYKEVILSLQDILLALWSLVGKVKTCLYFSIEFSHFTDYFGYIRVVSLSYDLDKLPDSGIHIFNPCKSSTHFNNPLSLINQFLKTALANS
jgi:hypothetical protein